MTLSPARSRLRSALRWLAPSAVAACAAALTAGLVEASDAGALGWLGALAGAGFVCAIGVPAMLAISALARGLWTGWRPDELTTQLIDPDGSAPHLAAWVAVIWLAGAGLASAMFQGVWLAFGFTAWKPFGVSVLMPILAVATLLLIIAASHPCARLFAWLARRFDQRWRRNGRRTLLRPPLIFAAAGAATLVALLAIWLFFLRDRLGPVDTSLIHAPAAGLAAAAILHAAWSRLPRARRIASWLCAAATAAALASAGYLVYARPAASLELWGTQPLAGVAIDALFDLNAIRARIALTQFRPASRPGAAHPDIILITIDTMRADHTPPYGGQADMPAMRALGERGTVFEWTFAPSNVTRRSIPSMITGISPDRVRGRVVGWALRMDPRHIMLAERLRAGGYDTAGFVCCEGFWGRTFRTGFERGISELYIEPLGTALAGRARAWLDTRERRSNNAPLFVWMHIIEPHNWTHGAGAARDAEQRSFYDRSLAASDQIMREALGAFDRRAPDQRPIVIVTADHGEALGEHGQPYHSTDLYNSQIRVPFVIDGPSIRAQRIAETVSLVDLVPTILELAGFVTPTGASIDGRSLAGLATGAQPAAPEGGVAFAAMVKDRSSPGGVTAIVRGRWKLIDNNGNFELYDVRNDPGEHNNVLAQQPIIAAELRGLLQFRTERRRTPPFDSASK